MTRTREDDDMLAAEYVLGTLPLADRAAAEDRLRRDADFARAVRDWEARLSGLNAGFEPVEAPDLLPRIEARLFPQSPPRRWGGWAAWGAMLTASVALAAFLTLSPLRPSLTAELVAENGLAYQAQVISGRLELTRAAGPGPAEGQDYELWLIVGEAAPVSLGLLQAETRLSLAEVPAGAILAISLEPQGGSPTGQPTGPVLAAAPLVAPATDG